MKNHPTPQKKSSASGSVKFVTSTDEGFQYRLFDSLPITPPPKPAFGTLGGAALECFLSGRKLIHPQFQEICGSWRLAAAVYELKKMGWPITKETLGGGIARYGIDSADLNDLRGGL